MGTPEPLVLTGPTASGKGAVAFELARRIDGEILSLDSMKVYREMDIGTAKPPARRRSEIRHHLIDIVDPDRHFSTGDYLPRLEASILDVRGRGKTPIICGGTALYLKAYLDGFCPVPAADWERRRRLLDEARRDGSVALHRRLSGVDPVAAERILPGDLRRIVRALEVFETTGRRLSDGWSWDRDRRADLHLFGIHWERPVLYARTDRRVETMVSRGLLDEARRLKDRDPPLGMSASQCIGYKEVFEGLDAGLGEAEIVERIQRDTRRFVKRQLSWFRKLPVQWIRGGEEPLDARRVAEEIAAIVRA